MTFNIKEVSFGSDEYKACLRLREVVLRIPLGRRLTSADVSGEEQQRHLAAFEGTRLVGCLILVFLRDGAVKMRQVAVADSMQRSGVGKELVRAAETLARKEGAKLLVLSARLSAARFYQRLLYDREGVPYLETGVPHVKMKKDL